MNFSKVLVSKVSIARSLDRSIARALGRSVARAFWGRGWVNLGGALVSRGGAAVWIFGAMFESIVSAF